MRLKHIKGAEEAVASSNLVEHNPKELKGKWKNKFGNDNPIHIEIGMGKGRFIMDLAEINPNVNYIGLERYSSVLLRGIEKLEERKLENVIFLCEDATDLPDMFEKGEIEKIYLNFSDPWPKDRHAKRRLPSRQFLAKFDQILKRDGKIEFKTDNRPLFDFALEELEPAGWKAEAVTYDLHNDVNMNEGNIMTEYEEKFSSKGNPICKYIIYR